jgi:hypothetical protein
MLYQLWMIDGDDDFGMIEWQGKPKYSVKPWPSGAPATTDPT